MDFLNDSFEYIYDSPMVKKQNTLDMARALRLAQNFEFEESLRADQEKDRQREVERQIREAEEARRLAEVQRIKELKIEAGCRVPDEPNATDPDACLLQVKLRKRNIQRYFRVSNKISDVHDWIFSQEDSPTKFEISMSYPRKIIYTTGAGDQIITEAGLSKRETLHINDLD